MLIILANTKLSTCIKHVDLLRQSKHDEFWFLGLQGKPEE
jgi:hypothetical protein